MLRVTPLSDVKDPLVKPLFVGVFLQINYLKQTQINLHRVTSSIQTPTINQDNIGWPSGHKTEYVRSWTLKYYGVRPLDQ